jgi:hypothetical protein
MPAQNGFGVRALQREQGTAGLRLERGCAFQAIGDIGEIRFFGRGVHNEE